MRTIAAEELARHERAVRLSIDAVEAASDASLSIETPCAGWDLRALLDHMGTQNRGFAAAARGANDPAVWTVHPAVDPIGDYVRSAHDVVEAFATCEARTVLLPEIPPGEFPAATALGFHLIDSVVHAWDVARSVGGAIAVDADLAPAALRIAEAVPTGTARLRPGAAFGPALEVTDTTATLARILRILGRAPEWMPRR
ncbi:TIGR03086 family metal-binding protein [Nocardia sp. FBN12]|uniref:TIGR03086 family metal-binding protein n=1 Tax=Nocardia sp. FBN12 TaxID=3419766 RepID=UPI003CFD2967